MSIGDMVRRMVAERVPRDPDGGIGGLTEHEETELSDLLNDPNRPGCGCEACS